MKTKLEIKAEKLLRIDSRRKAHNAALSMLHASPITGYDETDQHEKRGLKMWRKLRQLEQLAHRGATAYCNGESVMAPHHEALTERRYDFRTEENAWEDFSTMIRKKAAVVFGHMIHGFFVNGDPRGYALKLDPEKCTIPPGMEKDWGGYGILAAEINE